MISHCSKVRRYSSQHRFLHSCPASPCLLARKTSGALIALLPIGAISLPAVAATVPSDLFVLTRNNTGQADLVSGPIDFSIDPLRGASTGAQSSRLITINGKADFNGDGINDIGLGFLRDDTFCVRFGRATEGSSFIENGLRLDAPCDFTTGNSSGYKVKVNDRVNAAFAGDINGDGIHDVIMSCERPIPSTYNHALLVVVVFGRAHGTTMDLDIATITPSQGFTISQGLTASGYVVPFAVTDMSGDGIDDILIKSSLGSSVLFGKTVWPEYIDFRLPTPIASSEYFTLDIQGTADMGRDLNGDGVGDLIIRHTQKISVIYGGPHLQGEVSFNSLAVPTQGYYLDEYSDSVYTVEFIGDVNGDGLEDFAVGVYKRDYDKGPGMLFVRYGQSGNTYMGETLDVSTPASAQTGYKIIGAQPSDDFSYVFAGIPDQNGDGRPDFLVSSVRFGAGGGYKQGLFAENGEGDGSDAYYFYYFYSEGSRARLANAGKVDIIYSPSQENATSDFDLATDFVSGVDGWSVASLSKQTFFGDDSFGLIGDLNGDGLDDFTMGVKVGATRCTYAVFSQPSPHPYISLPALFTPVTTSSLPRAKPYTYAVVFGQPIYQYRPNGSISASIGTASVESYLGGNQYAIIGGDGPCDRANNVNRSGTLTVVCDASVESASVVENSTCVYDVLWTSPAFCY